MAYRLILLGSDEIALEAFAAVRVQAGIEIVAVYSQPDRPAGRGQEVQANPVAAWARAQAIPLRQPEKLTAADALALQVLQVDLGVVMAYGQILRQDFLDATRLGFINFHGSLLPALRGATPVEAALALNLPVTGVSLQQVVRQLDAGPLHATASLPVAPGEARAALRARLGLLAGTMVPATLPAILAGTSHPQPQDEAKVSFSRRLTRADAVLDFCQSAEVIASRIRALAGWPGSTFDLRGTVIKIGSAQAEGDAGRGVAGEIISADRSGVRIACGSGILRVTDLQRPGGKMLPAAEFLSGFPLVSGEVLPSLAMPPLVSEQPFPRAPKA